MSNKIEITRKYVSALKPAEIASDKAIGEHFVNKFVAMYRVPQERAVAFYEREKDNFSKRINEVADLKDCTSLSIFISFMQVGGWKLSFEGGNQPDIYLIPGNRNIGTKDAPNWIKEVVAQPSPYGEKKIRIENGQIKHVGSPTVVYDVDSYKEYTGPNGRTMVEWSKGKRTDKSIIVGSFILLEYPDGSTEFKTFEIADINSWKAASAKKNRGTANSLYTSNNGQIDKKFLEGKTLKHAFKLFPKVINEQKLPENFVPNQESAIRNGLDTSEFTEDVPHEEVETANEQPNNDDFSKALNEAQKSEKVETVTYEVINDDDEEPQF